MILNSKHTKVSSHMTLTHQANSVVEHELELAIKRDLYIIYIT